MLPMDVSSLADKAEQASVLLDRQPYSVVGRAGKLFVTFEGQDAFISKARQSVDTRGTNSLQTMENALCTTSQQQDAAICTHPFICLDLLKESHEHSRRRAR